MIVVGISGATCSGKTTVCNILRRLFINSRVFNQDDYYWKEESSNHIRDENGIINWEVMSSFDMDKMYSDIQAEIKRNSSNDKKALPSSLNLKVEDVFTGNAGGLQNGGLENGSLETKLDPAKFDHLNLILVEGILVLNDTRISDLCNYRFFFTLDKPTCWHRRQTRTYDPEDQEGYFERYAWPYYLSNLQEFRETKRPVTYLSGEDSIQQNLCNVLNFMSK